MYQRIVVPLDGSELAEKALPEAEQMARLTGGTVHLVRVVDLVQLPWYGSFTAAMDYATLPACPEPASRRASKRAEGRCRGRSLPRRSQATSS